MFAATINTIFSEKITLNVGDAAPQFTLENQDGVFEKLLNTRLFHVIDRVLEKFLHYQLFVSRRFSLDFMQKTPKKAVKCSKMCLDGVFAKLLNIS